MRTGIVVFATGIVSVAFLPALPSAWCWPALGGMALVLFRWPRLRPAAWLFLGMAWAGAMGAMALSHRLPKSLEGADVTVVGRVSSIPEPGNHRTRFRFTPSEITPWPDDRPLPRRIRLSWYARKPPVLHPGEHWRLIVRLKRPHGFSNPGGFDYETWLFANRVDAVGYVRSPRDARRLSGPAGLDSLRERLGRRLQALLAGHASLGVVIALAVGDRRLIDDDTWRLLRSTGTGHLVAISGLHVGMVALAGLFLVGGFWRRFPGLCLAVPAPLAGRCGAVVAAAAYSALAGFSLPTQRALVMVIGAAGLSLFRRRARPFDLWLAALAAVLAWDPLSPLSPGFWLSFGAVGVLIATGVGRYSAHRGSWRWLAVQGVLWVGLLPLAALWFGQVSWSAPMVNLIAIPVVTIAIVPLVLAGCALLALWPWFAAKLLQIAAGVADAGLAGLHWVARWGGDSLYPADPALLALLAAGAAMALAVAPKGWGPRHLVPVLLLPVLLGRPPAPPAGTARLTVLDVGQGESVVVRTRSHVLVYDTGPRFSDSFDAGSAVVVPYLRNRGIDRIDRLMISHGDADHDGGTASVLAALPVGAIESGEPLPETQREAPCMAGQQWSWDGVRFEVLHPKGPWRTSGNAASCVLAVTAHGVRALITGDIQAKQERDLVGGRRPELAADLLVAPHHGSAGSSTRAFVRAVAPGVVVFPAGYRNRYGFPRAVVRRRYRDAGARAYVTSHTGAVSFSLSGGGVGPVEANRVDRGRYWHVRR